MKKVVAGLFGLVVLGIIVAIGGASVVTTSSAGDVSTITDYAADFTVKADGDLDVVETLTVSFPISLRELDDPANVVDAGDPHDDRGMSVVLAEADDPGGVVVVVIRADHAAADLAAQGVEVEGFGAGSGAPIRARGARGARGARAGNGHAGPPVLGEGPWSQRSPNRSGVADVRVSGAASALAALAGLRSPRCPPRALAAPWTFPSEPESR